MMPLMQPLSEDSVHPCSTFLAQTHPWNTFLDKHNQQRKLQEQLITKIFYPKMQETYKKK